jgi:hypothetical protein
VFRGHPDHRILSAGSARVKKPLPREAFVLRIWKNAPHAAWIIEIQNVKTGEITHLQDLQAIPACIGDQLQVHLPVSTNPPEEEKTG